jgi:hypothetical protein
MKTLTKYHSPLNVVRVAPNDYDFQSFLSDNANWKKLEGAVFLSESFIDLNGLALEEETIFPDAMTIQEAGLGNAIDGGPGDSIVTMDIVSSVAIDMPSKYGDILFNGAGFLGGPGDFQHIQYLRTERHTLDIDTGSVFPFKAESNQAGSMAPTASDRLYVYRLVIIYPANSADPASLTLARRQGSRLVVGMSTKKEQEYQYMMRLKRSYDLQQSFDRD